MTAHRHDLDELERLCSAAVEAERDMYDAQERDGRASLEAMQRADDAHEELLIAAGTATIRWLVQRARDADRHEAVLQQIGEANTDPRDADMWMQRWEEMARDALAGDEHDHG